MSRLGVGAGWQGRVGHPNQVPPWGLPTCHLARDGNRSCHVARETEAAKDPVFRAGGGETTEARGRRVAHSCGRGSAQPASGPKWRCPALPFLLGALLTPQHAGEGRGSKGRRSALSRVVLGSVRSRAPCPDRAPSTPSLPQKPPAMAHTHRPPRLVVLPLSHFTDGEPEAQGAPITTGVAGTYWAPAACQALIPSHRPGLWVPGLFICFS